MEWQTAVNVYIQKLKAKHIPKKEVNDEYKFMSYLQNEQNINEFVCSWLENRYEKKKCKSVTKAQRFKMMGNKEFQAKNYIGSLEFYTKCALYAPANSCELPIAIANRSASLFYLNRYNDCIRDIKLAIKLNYPKELHYKLYLRELQCYLRLGKLDLAEEAHSKIQEIIQNSDYIITPSMRNDIEQKINEVKINKSEFVENVAHDSSSDFLKMKSVIEFEENPNFPNASISIDIKYKEELGRHVIANQDIKKGDILFFEKPLSFVLIDKGTFYKICQYCNRLNGDTPVSCTKCLNSFYCNENCLTEAWFSYHCWECSGNQMQLWEEIGIGHLALKVLLTCTTTTDKIRFNEMHNLVTNFDKLPIDDITVYGITAFMLTKYLLKYTNFFQTIDLEDCLIKKFYHNPFKLNLNALTENKKQLYICSLLLRYILQLTCNGFVLHKSKSDLSTENDFSVYEQDFIATGIYPSASIMNHSCDSNIQTIFVDQYLIVRASRNIAKDEEIFNCYGPSYRHMRTEDRQKNLKSLYRFTCKCDPCTLPRLKYFVERFEAMRCERCRGALCNINNFIYCLDCGYEPQENLFTQAKKSQAMFQEAEDSFNSAKLETALDQLKKCLKFQQKILYEYNIDITMTLNLMAKIYKMQKFDPVHSYKDSIICLENTLEAFSKKYGSSSVEFLEQLGDLTDVCFMYLKHEPADKSILKKTLGYLIQMEEIINLRYGCWDKIYDDIKTKKEKIMTLFP